MVGRGRVTARRRREKIYVLADKTVVSCEEVNTGSGEEKVFLVLQQWKGFLHYTQSSLSLERLK